MTEHYQSGAGAIQSRPLEENQAPWEVEKDEDLKKVYESNEPII